MRSLPSIAGLLTALIVYVVLDAFTDPSTGLHWLVGIGAGLLVCVGLALWLRDRRGPAHSDHANRGA